MSAETLQEQEYLEESKFEYNKYNIIISMEN